MTQETKRQIAEDYGNKSLRMADLETKYGKGKAELARIAVEMGAEPRRPKAWGKRDGNKHHVCPKCGKVTEIKGARFCCFCGADIRSKTEILVEKIEKVIGYTTMLPDTSAEQARQILVEVMEVLKGDEKI